MIAPLDSGDINLLHLLAAHPVIGSQDRGSLRAVLDAGKPRIEVRRCEMPALAAPPFLISHPIYPEKCS